MSVCFKRLMRAPHILYKPLMKYLFRDQWREVPRFAPYPACLLVNVQYAIPLAQVASHDQRHIKRDWRKVQQFLLAEGVGSTVRKIQSKREQEELLGDFHVVIAVGTLIEIFAIVFTSCFVARAGSALGAPIQQTTLPDLESI